MQITRDPSAGRVGPLGYKLYKLLGWARPRTGISASYAVIAWDKVG